MRPMLRRVLIRTLYTLLLLLLLLVLAWSIPRFMRPARSEQQVELFQGVTYTRQARSGPRLLMIHVVQVDLSAPGVNFLVTPGDENSSMDLPARTTSAFLKEFDVQVAINGSFSEPFEAGGLWDYYPHSGDPVNVIGLSISDGETYSEDYAHFPVLCIQPGLAEISSNGCPPGTTQALAGNQILVERGAIVTAEWNTKQNPRTAVALDAQGKTMWLIVVDGRQPDYSEGVTMAELAEIALGLGAAAALNLDGGGSSTLVVAGPMGPRTLNAPIHSRIPMRQRPVANHLGVYALPLGQDGN